MNQINIGNNNVSLSLLSKDDLSNWLEKGSKVGMISNLPVDTEEFDEYLKFVYQTKINNMEKDPGQEIWYSYYSIIFENRIIGTIGPKGKQDSTGTIEIGYGISEKYWNRGIITNAIGIFCDWYFKNTSINSIKAETNVTNIASQKVLIKNGFSITIKNNERITFIKYKIDISNSGK